MAGAQELDEGERGLFVPDFYREFQCKCGACRRCCCDGWAVTVSQDEYFRLLGEDCSGELRRRLDEAFYVPRDAAPERYAVLNRDYLGRCHLRREDGLCALQAELGEAALPTVCRLYPRGIRAESGEAALANSCERVVELLARRAEPVRFERLDLGRDATGSEAPEKRALRMACVDILQRRDIGIRQRLLRLGAHLCHKEYRSAPFALRMEALLEIARLYEEISPSIAGYCKNAAEAFEGRDECVFDDLSETLLQRFPYLNTLTEHLLVNHVFFTRFPYAQPDASAEEEFLALCGLFAFLRFLSTGNVEHLRTDEDLADLLADLFRVAEHTRFHHNVEVILRRRGMNGGEGLLV